MSDPVEKLAGWMLGQVEGATAVELSHLNGDGSLTRCERRKLPSTDEDDVADAAARLYAAAAEHAEAFPTAQTYQVGVMAKEGVQATHLFRVQGGAPSQLSPTEPPNDHGLVRMAMRHLEAKEKFHQQIVASTTATMAQQIERQQRRIEELEERRAQSFDLLEQLATQHQDRELTRLKAERGEARKDEALKSLKLLAPSIASGVQQKLGVANAGVHAAAPAIAELMKSLSYEQVQRMLVGMSPAQQAAFLGLYRHLALAGEPEAQDESDHGEAH